MKIEETLHYKKFKIKLDETKRFLNNFSELLSFNGHLVTFITDKKVHFLNSSLLRNSAKTIESIQFCCSNGSFSDANSLVRKLRDDLLLYVFVLTICNEREYFSEKDLKINPLLNKNEKVVEAWFLNSVAELSNTNKRRLGYENYMKLLKENPKIQHILIKYQLQNYWDQLSKKLNDYIHNNGVQFSNANLIRSYDKNLETRLSNVNFRVSYIVTFFLISIIMVDSTLISSTDMIDYLDLGLQPPDESQYEIAEFIQRYIDADVIKLHPELKQFLIDNNGYNMKIR